MKRALLATLLAMSAGGAFAQAYVGIEAGATGYNIDCEGATDCHTKDTGTKVYGGYRFTNEWSAELSYIDFGRTKGTVPYYGVPVTMVLESKSIALSAAFRAAFSPEFAAVARLGLANVSSKVTASAFGTATEDETAVKPLFGFSLEYSFTPRFKAVLSADFTEAEFEEETAATRFVGVGVQYNF